MCCCCDWLWLFGSLSLQLESFRNGSRPWLPWCSEFNIWQWWKQYFLNTTVISVFRFCWLYGLVKSFSFLLGSQRLTLIDYSALFILSYHQFWIICKLIIWSVDYLQGTSVFSLQDRELTSLFLDKVLVSRCSVSELEVKVLLREGKLPGEYVFILRWAAHSTGAGIVHIFSLWWAGKNLEVTLSWNS